MSCYAGNPNCGCWETQPVKCPRPGCGAQLYRECPRCGWIVEQSRVNHECRSVEVYDRRRND